MTISEMTIDNIIFKIGRLIQDEAKKGLLVVFPKTKKAMWQSAYIDTRKTSDSENWIAKFRVILSDGTKYGLFDTTRDMNRLFQEIWDIKMSDPLVIFYGLRVFVTPDGVITSEFDNDPNCSVDPKWFET